MTKVAIVGGGPGGLMTAYHLALKFTGQCQATLFEASKRVGGKIVSTLFDSAPVICEAGAAEFYDYSIAGPDPLLDLVGKLGLKTVPLTGQTVLLEDKILRSREDIGRLCGAPVLEAIDEFRARCAEALSPSDWYEGSPQFDNSHPWASRSCEEVLDSVADETARKYLKVAVHSDLATEPHLTNGLNGLKNFLMDVPGYLRIYSIAGGNEQFVLKLRHHLTGTVIATDHSVTRVERNPDSSYRVFFRHGIREDHGDFDAVFVALPHNSLSAVQWRGPTLRKAMTRLIAFYDRPGHYLRVSILFRAPFWRNLIADSWFMSDAFGGCCVYDESARSDCGEYGVLSWLIAGNDALSLSNLDDADVVERVLDSLPRRLSSEARVHFLEAKMFRWLASVSAQPGGLIVQNSRSAHVPEPKEHAGLFIVGDYLFDSTINGVLDSADFATDLFQSWMLKRRLLASSVNGNGNACERSFDPRYVRDLIGIVWNASLPYRLLDAGSASGLTIVDFAEYLRGDPGKLPFPDNHFDFVYETWLGHIPENQLERAMGELRRITRLGVIFGTVTSDMSPNLFQTRDLLAGVKTLIAFWEWGELFASYGFRSVANDPLMLRRLRRCQEKYCRNGHSWYPDECLRYAFYAPVNG